MAPASKADRDAYNASHPAPAVWAVRKPHRRVLRIVLAVAITAATLVTTWAASDILRDWVSSGGAS